MVELSTLVFNVNTSQLTEAAEKTQKLINLQKELGKTTGSAGGGSGARTPSQGLGTGQLDLLTKLDNLYKDLAQGATRWEASQLRAARQMGVPLDAVKEQLVGIRKLSQDPFDSAIGSVRSITQYFDQLTNRVSLANEGLLLTAKQMREFSRIPFEVEGQMKSRGASPKDTDNREYLRRVQQEEKSYIDTARAANELANAEKGRGDVLKQNANAHKFLTSEMQRVDAVIKEMGSSYGINAATQERSAAAVAKYATALERSGVSGKAAADKLEIYRQKVAQVAQADQERAGKRLSAALAPQISDVAVSLAGGMPFHLVMMQQGLQIRDLIGQARIDTEKLNQVFKKSMSDMVSSIGGTIAALSRLAFEGIKDAGFAVVNFAGNIIGVNSVLDRLKVAIPALSGTFSALGSVIGVVAGGAIVAAVAAIGYLTYSFVKLTGANTELSQTLATTGGTFAVTVNSSKELVNSMVKLGATTYDAMEILSLMANTGKLTAADITMVTKAAVDMEKYGGVAIADTVKAFSEMAKDPVKALTELAIRTGDVSPVTVKLAMDLKEQGRTAELVALAMGSLANQNKIAAERMVQDLSPLEKMYKALKKAASEYVQGHVAAINKDLGGGTAAQNLQEEIDRKTALIRQKSSLASVAARGGNSSDNSEIELLKSQVTMLGKKKSELEDIEKTASRTQLKNSADTVAQEAAIKRQGEMKKEYATKEMKATDALKKLEKDYADSTNLITRESYLEKKKEIEDSLKDKSGAGAANKAKAYSLSIDEKIRDAYNNMIASARELTLIEKKLQDIRDDPEFLEKTEAQKKAFIDSALVKNESAKAELAARKLTDDALADQIKSEKELLEFQQKLSIHGKDYEKTLVVINNARARGAILNDQEMNFQHVKNLERNSKSFEAAKKFDEEDKKSTRSLSLSTEEQTFRQQSIGRTDFANQQAQIEFDKKRQLDDTWTEYLANADQRRAALTGSALNESLDALSINYEARIGYILREGELKKQVLSEDAQRQKYFEDTVKNGFNSMADALVDFAVTGKASFGDMIRQMLIDLAKLEIRLQLMKLYEAGNSAGGGGGWLALAAKFLSFDGGGFTGSAPRSGGVDGKGGFPALLHPNETVIDHTKSRPVAQSTGGSSVQVVVNNYSGKQVEKKETVDSRGNRRVEVTIGEMTAGEVGRSGSSVQTSVGNTFGLRPQLLAR